MDRDQAFQILQKYITDQNLLKHSLCTEVTMRALARYFGEDEEVWGATGLLHDADYEMSKGHPEKHGLLLFEKEKDLPGGFPEEIVQAIKSHNYPHTNIQPESRLDWAITCCDELTAFVIACALITPEKKLSLLTNEFIMRKLRTHSFAKGADRTHIYLCQEKLGIALIEFVTITLTAMQEISDQLDL